MKRYDGKGFHPTVRPQFPHRKRERTKLKVCRRIFLKAWQLAMMKLGIRFIASESDRFELVELSSSAVALFEPICVEMECFGTGTGYIDTNGCAMLQANQANLPPRKGFACKALNRVKGFVMNLGKVLSLATLMAIANACHKDPVPNPTPTPTPVPTDTITPIPHDSLVPTPQDTIPQIIPTKDWVIDWDWHHSPDTNLIRQCANDPTTRTIVLNLLPSTTALSFCPMFFNMAYNNLEKKFFSISPDNTIGSGTIFVDEHGGAHLLNPQETDTLGMSLYDSLRYTAKGFCIARGRPPAKNR